MKSQKEKPAELENKLQGFFDELAKSDFSLKNINGASATYTDPLTGYEFLKEQNVSLQNQKLSLYMAHTMG